MTRDPGDTLPLFPGADFTAPGRWAAPDEVGTVPMFTAPEAPEAPAEPSTRHAPEPAPACDWPMPCDTKGCPDHGHDYCRDHDPRCGRPAVAVYVLGDHAYPRCTRQDTVAAQRRAATDGWARRPVAQEDPA